MKLNTESYLRGPINASTITEVLCYNSKVTNLVVDKYNLVEISEKILNLGITIDRNYVPANIQKSSNGIIFISIEPKKHLAYSPSSGFDTLIYYVKLDKYSNRFPIGFSKFPNVVGNSTLTEVESIYYNTIRINISGLLDTDDLGLIPSDIGDKDIQVTDPLKSYLLQYKKKKDLTFQEKVEAPIEVTNSNIYKIFPFTVTNQLITNSSDYYWKLNERVPIWMGVDSIRIKTSEYGYNEDGYVTLLNNNDPIKVLTGEMNFPSNKNIIDENYSVGDDFRDTLPKFISREFIVDQAGGLWRDLGLVGETTVENKKISPMFKSKNSITYFPMFDIEEIEQQPLLDLSKGVLVSKKSIFKGVQEAQIRIRDIVNTIIPLTLLFTDSGRLWIKLKIGAWFIFDLPQFNAELIQNRTTAVIVSKSSGCNYYPINDKSILIRSPKGLTLINTPGELCDQYTYDNIITRFPHSKLLTRFTTGGETINESDIYHSPLNRYRKNILPKEKINIIAALNGIIIYYYMGEDNNIYINYL